MLNAADVLTNIPIGLFALRGLCVVLISFIDNQERAAWIILFAAGLVPELNTLSSSSCVTCRIMVAPGSAYYHWKPNDRRLVWDRLPMTFVFTAMTYIVVRDRLHAYIELNSIHLYALALFGMLSVIVWAQT